jgi:ketosteroid isomerase-like protein
MNNTANRRKAIKSAVLGAFFASSIVQKASSTEASHAEGLRIAFRKLANALATGNLDQFYSLMDDSAIIIDEDIPFRLTKTEFKNHINFHIGGIWETFSWQDRNPQFRVFEDTGIVASYATFRGKPVDSGYRQRHMAFTQGWHRSSNGWKLINWHQSPFDGHVLEASPG